MMEHPEVVYNYTETVDPNLTCAICQSALVDPVTTASCKHTFCRDCITRALAHNPSCPIDRSALTLASLRASEPLVQLMLDELKVRCDADSCGKVMERGLLLAHIRSCASGVVTCGDEACGLSMTRHRMPHHRAYECFQRRMECAKCGIVFTFKEAKDDHGHAHGEAAAPGQAKCEACSQPMSTPAHLHRWVCPASPVPCPQQPRGCSAIVRRAHLESHMATCPFELLSGFFAANDARIAALEARVDELHGENELLRVQLFSGRSGAMHRPPAFAWAGPDEDTPETPTSPAPPLASADSDGSSTLRLPLSTGAGGTPRAARPPPLVLAPTSPAFELPPPPMQRSLSAASAEWVVGRLSENEMRDEAMVALRDCVVHLASCLQSSDRRNQVRTTTESLRVIEQVESLRAIVSTMRRQVMTERPGTPRRQSSDHYPALPTPPLSTQASTADAASEADASHDDDVGLSIRESVVFSAQGVLQRSADSSFVATAEATRTPRNWTGQPCAFPPPEPTRRASTTRGGRASASFSRPGPSRLQQLGANLLIRMSRDTTTTTTADRRTP
ncbi:E3 ubiquitin-protein ligase NRDP1 [Vanrija pseudolonga]|uniref:E3 ubiquitin-protein ligase NRDP1 n=1 Tax=Vanrija pseudolonga TaxID=143232 RepID=A0AAF0YBJ7_9TREE|nr:E3 ubiquitin-protein ligase NRDP1 [Vanrija pseudolonga]